MLSWYHELGSYSIAETSIVAATTIALPPKEINLHQGQHPLVRLGLI